MDQAGLKSLLRYDEHTGVFTWRVDRGPRKTGEQAGCLSPVGYTLIRLDGKLYGAHRLAWLYVNGVWPSLHIDHIDGDKGNNRIGNLREATRSQNLFNRAKGKSRSGLPGAYWFEPTGRWLSQIQVRGKAIYLGYFDTAEEASEAYQKAAKEHFGEFAGAA